jgi:hypothetical protein
MNEIKQHIKRELGITGDVNVEDQINNNNNNNKVMKFQ